MISRGGRSARVVVYNSGPCKLFCVMARVRDDGWGFVTRAASSAFVG